MRGLKVRSADTLHNWSAALLGDTNPGGLRSYVDAQDSLALPLAGGILTGPLILAADALNPLGATTLQQVDAAIKLAVDTLIGTAPAALNTVYELAAALNNDPNVIGSLTTLIGTKASLAGATFTGPVFGQSNLVNANGFVTLSDVESLIAAIPHAAVYNFSSRFVSTPNGTDFDVELATTGVTPGTYTKITVDGYGRATVGGTLVENDLPHVTPVAGTVFAGTSVTITDALDSLQAAVTGVVQNANGAEDNWTGTGATDFFAFTNIVGATAVAKPKRVLVFVDGIRQPTSTYAISSAGITFVTNPDASVEIEALQFD